MFCERKHWEGGHLSELLEFPHFHLKVKDPSPYPPLYGREYDVLRDGER
jgi:hypothetical protein